MRKFAQLTAVAAFTVVSTLALGLNSATAEPEDGLFKSPFIKIGGADCLGSTKECDESKVVIFEDRSWKIRISGVDVPGVALFDICVISAGGTVRISPAAGVPLTPDNKLKASGDGFTVTTPPTLLPVPLIAPEFQVFANGDSCGGTMLFRSGMQF